MRCSFAVLTVWMVSLLAGLSAAAQDKLAARVAADLKLYYEDEARQPFIVFAGDLPRAKPKPPPWEAPLKNLVEPDDRARVLRRFTEARLPDSFQFYRPLLDIKGKELGPVRLDRSVTETFAGEITNR